LRGARNLHEEFLLVPGCHQDWRTGEVPLEFPERYVSFFCLAEAFNFLDQLEERETTLPKLGDEPP